MSVYPNLEGFTLFYLRRCSSEQRRMFKWALARLSRKFPDANPRTVITEHLLAWIYEYERYLQNNNRQRGLRDEPWTLEGDKADRIPGYDDLTQQVFNDLRSFTQTDFSMDPDDIDLP